MLVPIFKSFNPIAQKYFSEMRTYFRDLAKRDRQGKCLLEESGNRWQAMTEENLKRQTIAAVSAEKTIAETSN